MKCSICFEENGIEKIIKGENICPKCCNELLSEELYLMCSLTKKGLTEEEILTAAKQKSEIKRKIKEGKSFRFHNDIVWYKENKDEILRNFEGKFIAILDRRIVDSDKNFENLIARLFKILPYQDIYIPFVERKERIIEIPSPFLKRGE